MAVQRDADIVHAAVRGETWRDQSTDFARHVASVGGGVWMQAARYITVDVEAPARLSCCPGTSEYARRPAQGHRPVLASARAVLVVASVQYGSPTKPDHAMIRREMRDGQVYGDH